MNTKDGYTSISNGRLARRTEISSFKRDNSYGVEGVHSGFYNKTTQITKFIRKLQPKNIPVSGAFIDEFVILLFFLWGVWGGFLTIVTKSKH